MTKKSGLIAALFLLIVGMVALKPERCEQHLMLIGCATGIKTKRLNAGWDEGYLLN